jgi:molybdopterin-guanine dinucleotide biosynthesis protein A
MMVVAFTGICQHFHIYNVYPMEQLLGMVMCGGQSSRMGTDKGLIVINDTCWAGYMATKLKALELPFIVSINASQAEKYTKYFSDEQLVIDASEANGPVRGILSVHFKYPDNDLLLVACDMIDMQETTLQSLVIAYTQQPGSDFYTYHNNGFFEPFCAIYTAKGLQSMFYKYGAADLAHLSLQRILREGNTKELPVTEAASFNNYNSRT